MYSVVDLLLSPCCHRASVCGRGVLWILLHQYLQIVGSEIYSRIGSTQLSGRYDIKTNSSLTYADQPSIFPGHFFMGKYFYIFFVGAFTVSCNSMCFHQRHSSVLQGQPYLTRFCLKVNCSLISFNDGIILLIEPFC